MSSTGKYFLKSIFIDSFVCCFLAQLILLKFKKHWTHCWLINLFCTWKLFRICIFCIISTSYYIWIPHIICSKKKQLWTLSDTGKFWVNCLIKYFLFLKSLLLDICSWYFKSFSYICCTKEVNRIRS